MIADAGGGTIDVSTFEVTKSSPIELKECVPPDGKNIFLAFPCARNKIEPLFKGGSLDQFSSINLPRPSYKVCSKGTSSVLP